MCLFICKKWILSVCVRIMQIDPSLYSIKPLSLKLLRNVIVLKWYETCWLYLLGLKLTFGESGARWVTWDYAPCLFLNFKNMFIYLNTRLKVSVINSVISIKTNVHINYSSHFLHSKMQKIEKIILGTFSKYIKRRFLKNILKMFQKLFFAFLNSDGNLYVIFFLILLVFFSLFFHRLKIGTRWQFFYRLWVLGEASHMQWSIFYTMCSTKYI